MLLRKINFIFIKKFLYHKKIIFFLYDMIIIFMYYIYFIIINFWYTPYQFLIYPRINFWYTHINFWYTLTIFDIILLYTTRNIFFIIFNVFLYNFINFINFFWLNQCFIFTKLNTIIINFFFFKKPFWYERIQNCHNSCFRRNSSPFS